MSEKGWYPGKLIGRVTKKDLLKQREFSRWPDLQKFLEEQLKDELRANMQYEEYAMLAGKLGLFSIERALGKIATDEKRHHDTIKAEMEDAGIQ